MEKFKAIVAIAIAVLTAILDFLRGKDTTLLISPVKSEPKDLAGCEPILSWYKVSYFYRVPFPSQPGMFKSIWISTKVQAYSAMEAAAKLGLKAGYNCFVSRQLGV